jgi:hypothetical protein
VLPVARKREVQRADDRVRRRRSVVHPQDRDALEVLAGARDEHEWARDLERDPHADGIAVHQLTRTVGDTVAVHVREAQQLAGRREERPRAVRIARRNEERSVGESRQPVREVQAGRERGDPKVVGVHARIAADRELGDRGIGEHERGRDDEEQRTDQTHGSRTRCAIAPCNVDKASKLPIRKMA